MNKKIIGITIVLLLVSLVFTACERSASGAPAAVPTATESEIPFPVATQPQIMADILKQTQTAMALTQQTGGLPVLATSTSGFSFSTPGVGTPGVGTPGVGTPGVGTPQVTGTPAVGGVGTPMVTPTSTSSILVTSTPATIATPTATKIAYPTPTPGRPTQYTIQAGEFMWCIARRFDVNAGELLTLNGMNANSRPYAGTVINIPTSGAFDGTRALKTHPTTYTVMAGDTMGSIACGFGDADPNTIYAANGLAVDSVITVGQVLQIP